MKNFIEKYIKPNKKEIIIGGSIIAAIGGIAAACVIYGYSKKPMVQIEVPESVTEE